MQDGPVKIGIIGASGFAGSEVLRLTASHPSLELAWATGDSQAGTAIADLYPSLAAAYGGQRFVPYDTALLADVDAVFLALPHGASQAPVHRLQIRSQPSGQLVRNRFRSHRTAQLLTVAPLAASSTSL